MNNDLISREALKKAFLNHSCTEFEIKNMCRTDEHVIALIDNAPSVEAFTENDKALAYCEGYVRGSHEAYIKPQGEYVPINKLRLMTVEECAGHTIDYAMGWKACIDWLKKGGAE